MPQDGFLVFLIVGAIAGWLAGNLMKGGGFGLVGNIVVGLLGAFVGGWVLGRFGMFPAGLLGNILTSTLGAIILLSIVRVLKKA